MSPRRPPAPAAESVDALSLFEDTPRRTRAPQAELAEDLFPGASARSAIAVSTLTQTAKDVLEGAFVPLWVRGEVIDFKSHRNGHWYFCLRDRTAQLRCVVWSREQVRIPSSPDDGMQVMALGQLGVYASRGEMQFTVVRIEAEGDGLRRKALERTRLHLEADGLLAVERKRALPKNPRRIAIVTSRSGAALRDVMAVLRKRAPGVELVLVHAAVQGDSAPYELCAALDRVARWGRAELVIVGRGGGSREDLWAFNDERVARAVAACPVPTISAVGHEIDMSICDLVADVRAPTPSAAAELAVASRDETVRTLLHLRRRMERAAHSRIEEPRHRAVRAAHRIAAATSRRLHERDAKLATLAGRLNALSPLATLERGFAVPSDQQGRTLSSVDEFREGMPFNLRVVDGVIRAIVRGAGE